MANPQPTFTVYKASAGSGKTFTLAVEYIALLVTNPHPNAFQQILAVTFTNKATAEMKSRILQYLYGLGNELPSCRQFMQVLQQNLEAKQTPVEAPLIRSRAKRALRAILHDYTHFRVETIDSFFQSVLRNLAHELGLNANLQIELNNNELVSRAVDRLIENLKDQNDEIKDWIHEYMESQMEEGNSWKITESIRGFARCIFDEAFQHRSQQERNVLEEESTIKAFRKKMKDILLHAEETMKTAGEQVEREIESMTLNFSRISNGERWYRSAIRKMATLHPTFAPSPALLKVIDGNYEALLNKKDQKGSDAGILYSEAQTISQLLSQLLDTYTQVSKEQATAKLASRYINELRLLGCIEQRVNEIREENNQFSLSNTPALLSQLIQSDDAPFFFEKIGTKLSHIMIDEFQDTSEMQWKNFKVLLLENQSTDGQDLVVGDIKQSIYRWRNGKWEILKGIQDEMKRMNVQLRNLDTNYRSQRRIIDFNNRFFLHAAPLLDSIEENPEIRIADIYQDVSQQCSQQGEKGYVHITLYDKAHPDTKTKEEYASLQADDIITEIRRLQEQHVPLEEMAFLVRNNWMGGELIQLFQEKAPDIKLVSDEAYLLEAGIAIQMLIACLRYLVTDPEKDPVPLFFLTQHYTRDILKQDMNAEDYMNAERCLAQLPDVLTQEKETLKKLPLYVLCEKLYADLRLSEIAGQEAYMMAFLDEIQNYIRNNPSDIHTFLTAWDETLHKHPIPAAQADGIRILTIHKSKGLEFHTVFVPYTDWAIEDDRGETMWCTAADSKYNDLGPLPISQSPVMDKSHYSHLYQHEHLQQRIDTLNILYVAFTRAGNNLYIFGKTGKGQVEPKCLVGDLMLQHIMQAKEGQYEAEEGVRYTYSYGEIDPYEQQKQQQEDAQPNRMALKPEQHRISLQTFPPDLNFQQSNQSARFIQSLDSHEPEDKQQTYLDIGKLMHYVLSQIRTMTDVPNAINECKSKGLITDEKTLERLIDRLNHGFNNKMIKDWFSEEVRVYNECSIISREADGTSIVRRPDRVIMTDRCITVIDYKFGASKPAYRDQVMQYMQLLQQMYPQHRIAGYLWFIYSGKTEEIES